MTTRQRHMLVTGETLDLAVLMKYTERPALFAPGEPLFWNDPYIARQMLVAHLDPSHDAASRQPDTITCTTRWIVQRLGLQPRDHLLDLGCGPGLYCEQFHALGLLVTGIDFSENSIRYAQQSAQARNLPITYRVQNYLQLDDVAQFNAVTLIYGDFCVLSESDRATVLANIHRALRPGGHFVFDVMTPLHPAHNHEAHHWCVTDGGFWKPRRCLELHRKLLYPEATVQLDQYLIIESDGTINDYRIWTQLYTVETITALLNTHGFTVCEIYSDLMGGAYMPDSEWLGIIARRDG